MSEDLAVVIVFVTLILTVGGVTLLRPLTRRLGELLEVVIQEKRAAGPAGSQRPVPSAARERLEERVGALEERLDFAEALLSSSRSKPPELASAQARQVEPGTGE